MGRKKIAIEYLTCKTKRSVTRSTRTTGLYKKAHELAALCGLKIQIMIKDENGNEVTASFNENVGMITDKPNEHTWVPFDPIVEQLDSDDEFFPFFLHKEQRKIAYRRIVYFTY